MTAKSFGLVLYPDFETLDVYGVIGLIGTNLIDGYYDITLIPASSEEIIIPTSNIPTMTSLSMDQALLRHWDVVTVNTLTGSGCRISGKRLPKKLNILN